jgi:hypothetical protein
MKMDELMKQIVLELGFPAEASEQAQRFADTVVQGPEIKEFLDKDLTDKQIEYYRMYVYVTLGRAMVDPEFKEKFIKLGEELFKRN